MSAASTASGAYADPRTRGRIKLDGPHGYRYGSGGGRGNGHAHGNGHGSGYGSDDGPGYGYGDGMGGLGKSRIPTDLMLGQVFVKTLLASAALLARHWLLTGHSEALHHMTAGHSASGTPHGHHRYGADRGGGEAHLAGSLDAAAAAAVAAESAGYAATTVVREGGISVWAVGTVAFVLAAAVQGLWLRTWTWLPGLQRARAGDKGGADALLPKLVPLALAMFAHLLVWLMALERLPAVTVVIFTQFCEIWAADLVKSMRGRGSGGFIAVVALGLSFIATVARGAAEPATKIDHASLFADDDLEDLPPSLRRARPAGLASPSALRAASASAEANAALFSPTAAFTGHALLLVYALLTLEKERGTRAAASFVGGRRKAQVIACTLAAAVALPLGLLGRIAGFATLPPLRSLAPDGFSPAAAGTGSGSGSGGHLAAYIVLAVAALVLEPLLTAALAQHGTPQARTLQGWALAALAAVVVGYTGFAVRCSLSEVFVGALVCWSLWSILGTSPDYQPAGAATGAAVAAQRAHGHQRKPSEGLALVGLAQGVQSFVRASQTHIQAILANKDSRSIFQFLCLNFAFMGVQLAWGVWTNSLGLISDAIHMFFDCAAIGMGLFASVMSTWKTDGTFTFGYSRVETLSGFANGVFLILISIFIVFEAIQRIIEPPEMHNTMQLLLVSGMGLAVNLFGMFAMGGHHHHHHGHSHGHGHDHHHHGHGHDHGHGHGHGHDHGHGHSHNMMGVYLHVMADTLGSVGVIVSTLLIKQFGWTGFDPIASLFIAALIVASVIPLVLDAGRILCLDMGDHKGKQVVEALEALTTIEGVQSYSSPRFWPKDAEAIVGTIHIQVADSEPLGGKGGVTAEQIAARVEQMLKGRIEGLESISVQIDRQPRAQVAAQHQHHQPPSPEQQHSLSATSIPVASPAQLHPQAQAHHRHAHAHTNGSSPVSPEQTRGAVF